MHQPALDTILLKHQHAFAPVVPFNPSKDKLLPMDFTAANTALSDEILNDTAQFSHWISDQLAEAGARYGIGGYAEHRTIYSRSHVFDGNDNEEPRRLHLGIDIWGKPYTHVSAPIDGIVHSFAFNDRFGDYGATIILSHQLEGASFHSLYGHLSVNSIKNLREGDRVEAGDIIAEFGIPIENGHWPPHLHFQLIKDLQDNNGDYLGVCKFSEREKYLSNCPDPDMVLQLNKYL
jgi:murein DD-endopeptidase MepM/ murein hydrolase activator NlpD